MARNYRTGTMTEVRPGVWRLRVTAGTDPETGHAVQRSKTVTFDRRKGTKTEAQAALREFYDEVRANKTVGRVATVGRLLTDWLANLERLGKARSTVETYTIHVEKHIRPDLGSIRLDKLTTHDVDKYLASLDAKGLAPRTIKLNHSTLRAALEQAVDWGWLKDNPAKRARLKSARAAAATALTTDQLGKLCQAALVDDADMAVVIALAAITGMRRGELAGLRWDDLDTEARTLRVERQWVPGKGGQHLTDETKTGQARTVYIGADGVELLERYRATLAERMGCEPYGWLFSYNGGRTAMRAKSMTEYFTGLAKRVEVPATLHTLRHWASSELQHLGVDLPTAAARTGHSVEVMASTYLHTTDDRGAAAGELIAAVVAKAIGAG